jgi:hypothetical protein
MKKSIYLSFPIEFKGIMKNETIRKHSRLEKSTLITLISSVLFFGGVFLYTLQSSSYAPSLSPATAFLVLPADVSNESSPAPQATGPWTLTFSESDPYSTYSPVQYGWLELYVDNTLVNSWNVTLMSDLQSSNLQFDLTPYISASNVSNISFRIVTGSKIDIFNISITNGNKRVRFASWVFSCRSVRSWKMGFDDIW